MSLRSLGVGDDLHAYLVWAGVEEPAVCAHCRQTTAARTDARMQISVEQGQFMDWLVRTLGVRRAVEIGTFTGYSALRVGLALPEDGQLVCCDVNPETGAVAQAYWEQAGIASKVSLRLGPAVDTLDALIAAGEGTFDFAFIDADKSSYAAYLQRVWALLRTGGVVLIDNVLWSGRVIDPADTTIDTEALRALNAGLREDPRWDRVMLPVGDGLTLLRKR